MTDFIPGDSYRLDIVGADSSIIIDSWLSQVKASVVNKDGQLQVDTTFGKLYGPMVGDVEHENGDILLNADSRTAYFDVVGSIKNQSGDKVLDMNTGLLTGNLKGSIVNSIDDELVWDASTSTFKADRIVGDFYGTLHGELDLIGEVAGTFRGKLNGDTTGHHYGNVTGTTQGTHIGEVKNEAGVVTLQANGDLNGNLKGKIISPEGNSVLEYHNMLHHYNLKAGIEHHKDNKTILELNEDHTHTTLRAHIGWYDGTNILSLSAWDKSDKPDTLAEYFGDVVGGDYLSPNKEAMLRYRDATQLLGTNNGVIEIGHDATETVKIFGDSINYHVQSNPVNTTNLAHINYMAVNGDVSNKLPINPGDSMMISAVHAWDGTNYKIGGGFGFFANTEIVPDPDLEIYPTDFGITLSDGRTLPSAFWDNPTGLNFNGKGVLSVPIFQAKGHTEASKTEVETKEGMIIFNTTLKKFQGYDGSAWVNLH
tara:strand:- start:4631 stop:6073 length:1443 start_codon:yes stop_codon:yes gene_type:complete